MAKTCGYPGAGPAKALWRAEFAADTDATWFVGTAADRVHVLAPPGVSISRRMEFEEGIRHQDCGWRWAVWNGGGEPPAIEADLPTAVRDVDTVAVLRLLDDDLHAQVWDCLWEQLQVARAAGRGGPDARGDEDLARAAARAEAWLGDELSRAFPDRAGLLETHEASEADSPPPLSNLETFMATTGYSSYPQ